MDVPLTTGTEKAGKGFALALLAVILWSGNFIVARALHATISPVSLAFYRWSIATLVLGPLAWRSVWAERQLLLPHLPFLSLTALAGVTVFNTLFTWPDGTPPPPTWPCLEPQPHRFLCS